MSVVPGNGRLAGQSAIVIGGAGGICSESALRLIEDGAAVLLMDRQADALEAARARLVGAVPGARVEIFTGNGLLADDVTAALEAAHGMAGRLDMIVQGIGGGRFRPILMHDVASFMKVVELNVVPTFLAIRHGAPLLERGGSITCISSTAAGSVTPWMAPYMVGKAGVEQLVQAAAEELGAAGIRVNAVRPGMTLTAANGSPEAQARMVEAVLPEVPLGRTGVPADIAAAVRYLAGPESSWVTGQIIAVDGGGLLRKNPANTDLLAEMYGPEAVAKVLAGKVP